MKELAKAALSYEMSGTEDNTNHREEALTAHCQVFNYVLETYATDNVIAEAKADIISDKQPEGVHHSLLG